MRIKTIDKWLAHISITGQFYLDTVAVLQLNNTNGDLSNDKKIYSGMGLDTAELYIDADLGDWLHIHGALDGSDKQETEVVPARINSKFVPLESGFTADVYGYQDDRKMNDSNPHIRGYGADISYMTVISKTKSMNMHVGFISNMALVDAFNDHYFRNPVGINTGRYNKSVRRALSFVTWKPLKFFGVHKDYANFFYTKFELDYNAAYDNKSYADPDAVSSNVEYDGLVGILRIGAKF